MDLYMYISIYLIKINVPLLIQVTTYVTVLFIHLLEWLILVPTQHFSMFKHRKLHFILVFTAVLGIAEA